MPVSVPLRRLHLDLTLLPRCRLILDCAFPALAPRLLILEIRPLELSAEELEALLRPLAPPLPLQTLSLRRLEGPSHLIELRLLQPDEDLTPAQALAAATWLAMAVAGR